MEDSMSENGPAPIGGVEVVKAEVVHMGPAVEAVQVRLTLAFTGGELLLRLTREIASDLAARLSKALDLDQATPPEPGDAWHEGP